jgi:hypothetical protein
LNASLVVVAGFARVHESHVAVAGVDAGFEYARRTRSEVRNRHREKDDGEHREADDGRAARNASLHTCLLCGGNPPRFRGFCRWKKKTRRNGLLRSGGRLSQFPIPVKKIQAAGRGESAEFISLFLSAPSEIVVVNSIPVGTQRFYLECLKMCPNENGYPFE